MKLQITLKKSPISSLQVHKDTVAALGLHNFYSYPVAMPHDKHRFQKICLLLLRKASSRRKGYV